MPIEKRDFISILDIEKDIDEFLRLTARVKKNRNKLIKEEPLKNRSLAMLFEKPSTRTRLSFEIAMTELGGHALFLSPNDLQLGRGETIEDTAKVISRYANAIMYRAYDHNNMLKLAKYSSIPVINALDNVEHPCQILADLFTIKEKKTDFEGLKLTYLGDGNNICNSLLLGSAIVGLNFVAGCPEHYFPKRDIYEKGKEIARKNGTKLEIVTDPIEAIKNADIVYTDVWVSMGDEKEKTVREKVFPPYQVNSKIMKHAKDDAIIMHCLPAHRGMEITDEVIDSSHSVVFDQAENRLHAQKAVLLKLIKIH